MGLAGLLVAAALGPPLVAGVVLAAVAVLWVCHGAGLHRPRLGLSVLSDLPVLALAGLVAAAVCAVTGPAGAGPLDGARLAPAALLGVGTFAIALALRTVSYAVVRVLRVHGTLARPVVVVGTDRLGRQLVDTLLLRPELGLQPVGLVDCGPTTSRRDLPLPLVGEVEQLLEVLAELDVHDVVVAFPDSPDAATVGAIGRCVEAGHRVFVVPRFHELVEADGDRRTELVRGLALTRLRPPARRERGAGRVVDLVVAVGALLVLSPVLLVLAVAVRIETGARPLVRQTRHVEAGADTQLVFRTLRPAAFDADETTWRLDAERRVGPVGRFLRRSGLEELPRLLDVLQGTGVATRPGGSWPGGRAASAGALSGAAGGVGAAGGDRVGEGAEGWAWMTPPGSQRRDDTNRR